MRMKSYARFDTLEQIFGAPEGIIAAAGGDRVLTLACATPKNGTPAPKGAPEPASVTVAKRGARGRNAAATVKAPPPVDASVRGDPFDLPPGCDRRAGKTAAQVRAETPPTGGTRKLVSPSEAMKTTGKAKPASKGRKTAYDWDAVEKAAKEGTLPKMPPFVSYAPHIKDVLAFAKKGEAKAIGEYVAEFKGYGKWKANAETDAVPTSRANLFRFAHLCLTALRKAKK